IEVDDGCWSKKLAAHGYGNRTLLSDHRGWTDPARHGNRRGDRDAERVGIYEAGRRINNAEWDRAKIIGGRKSLHSQLRRRDESRLLQKIARLHDGRGSKARACDDDVDWRAARGDRVRRYRSQSRHRRFCRNRELGDIRCAARSRVVDDRDRDSTDRRNLRGGDLSGQLRCRIESSGYGLPVPPNYSGRRKIAAREDYLEIAKPG